MIVRFTRLGATAFWQMVCNPTGAQFKTEDWHRAGSPTEEVEVAKGTMGAILALTSSQIRMLKDLVNDKSFPFIAKLSDVIGRPLKFT